MPFEQSIPRSLTATSVNAYAPTASGVYGISNSREWIYIGATDNIRGALLADMQELETFLIRPQPVGFVFELCDRATRPARQNRLVLEYEPTYNRRVPRHPKGWSGATMAPHWISEERTLRYILTGFTQNAGFRIFTFEGITADETRTRFVVDTDLALTRRYGIRLQELPLLCRELLQRHDEREQARTFTFTEAEMVLHTSRCAAEQEVRQRRNSMHKSTGKHAGSAWRTPQR
jgi:hypothetical protein